MSYLRRAHWRLTPLALALALVACTSGAAPRSLGQAGGGQSGAGTTNAGASGSDASSTGAAGTGPGGSGGDGGNGGATPTSGAGGTSSDAGPGDATGSGGAPDAANDAPTEGGTPGCAGLLCEDFESGAIDPGKWDTVMSGSTVTVQQQMVAHGKYAMHVHGASGASDWAQLVAKNVPAALKGTTTFGRVYFYITKPLTSGHTEMIFAGNTGTGAANGPAPFPKLRYMEVSNINGGWQLSFDLLDVSPLVEEVAYPKGQVPTTAWVCLEWEFQDSPDHITMWNDGTQIGVFDNTDVAYAAPGPVPKPGTPLYNGKSSDIVGGYDTFGFGFHDWHPQQPFDLYYDDLVLGTTRVGCLK